MVAIVFSKVGIVLMKKEQEPENRGKLVQVSWASLYLNGGGEGGRGVI